MKKWIALIPLFLIASSCGPQGGPSLIGHSIDGGSQDGGGGGGGTSPSPAIPAFWAKTLGAANYEHEFEGVARDAQGNLYAVGYTDAQTLNGETNTAAQYYYGATLTKYDAAGNLKWLRFITGSGGQTEAYAVVVDPSGNPIVTGHTNVNLGGQTKTGTESVFVAKYTPAGDQTWVRLLNGSTGVRAWAYGVTVDSSNKIVLAGTTAGGATFDGVSITGGGSNAFVSKFDSSGNKEWTQLFSSTSMARANDVITNSSGEVFVTGWARTNINGQNTTGTEDGFVMKLSSTGTLAWLRLVSANPALNYGGVPDDGTIFEGINVLSNGDVIVTGETRGLIAGQTRGGFIDSVVARYDASGTRVWIKQFGYVMQTRAQSVGIDSSDNIYIGGHRDVPSTVTPGNNNRSAFVTKFEADGDLVWSEVLGSTVDGQFIIANDLTVSPDGKVYLCGRADDLVGGQSVLGYTDSLIAKVGEGGDWKPYVP